MRVSICLVCPCPRGWSHKLKGTEGAPRTVALKVQSPLQQQQHPLESDEKCKFPGPTSPARLNHNSRSGSQKYVFEQALQVIFMHRKTRPTTSLYREVKGGPRDLK